MPDVQSFDEFIFTELFSFITFIALEFSFSVVIFTFSAINSLVSESVIPSECSFVVLIVTFSSSAVELGPIMKKPLEYFVFVVMLLSFNSTLLLSFTMNAEFKP